MSDAFVQPFVAFTWSESALDQAFGNYAPNDTANQNWVVSFYADQFKIAGLPDPGMFRVFAEQAIANISPAGELHIAPLTSTDVNRIWLSAACGYENEMVRKHSTDKGACDERFNRRFAWLEAGNALTPFESLALFERNVPKGAFMSNMAASELFALEMNRLTNIPDLCFNNLM